MSILKVFYKCFCWRVCKGPHAFIVYDASEKPPVSWFLWRETRFCWSLARLGCRENALFEAFEVRLREVLDKLQYKDPNMTLFGNSKTFKRGIASVPMTSQNLNGPTADRSWKLCTISWLSWNGWISAWVKILIVLYFKARLVEGVKVCNGFWRNHFGLS